MSSFYGGKIVTNGLVAAYDFSNTKSYSGEPTTNVKANLFNNRTSPDMNYSTGRVVWEQAMNPNGLLDYVLGISMPTGGVNNKQWYWTNQGNYQGQTLTLSWWARSTDGSSFSDSICIAEGGYGAGNTATYYTVTPEWRRYSVTRAIVTTNSITLGSAEAAFTADKKVQYWGLQLEAKSYATSYTTGTRSLELRDVTPTRLSMSTGTIGYTSAGPTFRGVSNTDYLQSTSSSVINTPASLTLEVWLRGLQADQNATHNIYVFGCPDQYSIQVAASSSPTVAPALRLLVRDVANTGYFAYANSSTNVMDGNWKHLVFTYNGSAGTAVSYVNNVVVSSASSLASSVRSLPAPYHVLGAFVSGYGYFKGDIPIARHYDRPLTAAEVSQNYNASKNRFGL